MIRPSRSPFRCAPVLWLLPALACGGAAAEPPTPTASRAAVSRQASAHPDALQVASLGGGLQEAQQATLFKPFNDQTDIALHVQGWDGSLSTLQKRAASGAVGWDLVLMEEAPLRVACRQGLFIPDPRSTGDRADRPDSTGAGCGVSAWRESIVLAWDKGRVDSTPTWADFWDVARRPGKRGLKRDPRGTLEIALMADGVAPSDIYRTLQTPDGINRAFRKLDQLKPYIVWWQTPAEAVQIIESGAVLMTSAPSGEIATADRLGNRHFGTQWQQSLGDVLDWGITRSAGPAARDVARHLLDFTRQPDRAQAFAAAYLAQANPSPSTTATAADPPGATASTDKPAPAAPVPRHADTLMLDEDFWAAQLEPLGRRFEAWISAK